METDAEVGSTAEERNATHPIRPVEDHDTSLPTEEPHRGTDDDSRITPSRGEYEEEDDDESWHDAREDWWEEVAYEEAKTDDHEEKPERDPPHRL